MLGTPWQDTVAYGRSGWRERAASLNGEDIFAVDYNVCSRCRLGWVEMPHTHEDFLRCGLATAGLAALRTEHPGVSWHTLGGHYSEAEGFWTAAGQDVPGGYQQRALCPHLHA